VQRPGGQGTGVGGLWTEVQRPGGRGAGKAKPISHRVHRGHREGKNVPASPGRAKAKRLFRQASSFENKINCTVQRSRALQDELDWLLRNRARARSGLAQSVGLRTRASLSLTEGTEGTEKGKSCYPQICACTA
jgi:hypothetical protein